MDFLMRAEKLNPMRKQLLRTVMNRTGWTAYEAFIYINQYRGDRKNYKEAVADQFWRGFLEKTADRLEAAIAGKRVRKEPFINISEAHFNELFYTERQKKAISEILQGKILLRTFADFAEIELPEDLRQLDTNFADNMFTQARLLKQDGVFLAVKNKPIPAKLYENKPLCVIGNRKQKELYEEAGFRFIVCENLISYVLEISAFYKKHFNAKAICITGSVGKTTTTDMIRQVISAEKNIYRVEGNWNETYQVCDFVRHLNPSVEAFIQEASGAAPWQCERTGLVMQADVFVLTNIGNGHIGMHGNRQSRLLYGKLGLDRKAAPGAIGVINWDDPLLSKVPYHHPIKRCSMKDRDAEYFAENVVEKDETLSFDLIENRSQKTHVVLNVCGIHNVYNAMAAFACGVQMGVSRKAIVTALQAYRPQGVRQNLTELAGRKVYLDCYSATEESMKTAMQALGAMSVPEGGRRVAVLADIPDLGEEDEMIHRRVGVMCGELRTADEIYFYGPSMSVFAAEEAEKAGLCYRKTSDQAELTKWIREDCSEKDVVCFKASHRRMLQWVVDDLFGTDFFTRDLLSNHMSKIAEIDDIQYKVTSGYGCTVVKAPAKCEQVVFRDEVNGTFVRILQDSLLKDAAVSSVVFPKDLQCIGANAFYGCSNLTSITLPEKLVYIGSCAFAFCQKLKEISIPRSVTTIAAGAFSESGLIRAVIPSNVKTIEPGAFGAGKLTIVCEKGSAAEKYAAANEIAVEYM